MTHSVAYTLPAALIIMDGFGIETQGEGNAISMARTPNLDIYFNEQPHIQLQASGEAVGLPAGQMGNSEVGHLNIGAGRIVYQELSRINRACSQGEIASNQVLLDAMRNAVDHRSALHFMGLLSDGGVHSNNEHLFALLRLAGQNEVPLVLVHAF